MEEGEIVEEGRRRRRRTGEGECTEEEEGHALLSIPSPPTPQQLRSDSGLQEVVNVFHFLFPSSTTLIPSFKTG